MLALGSNCHAFMMKIIRTLFIVLCSTICFIGSRNVDVNFPIIYSKPFSSERNTYFGYSVVLHEKWVQIGAPRANYSNSLLPDDVLEPGVVYRCPILKPCEEVILDMSGNEKVELNRENVWDNKNNSWIGVAMELEPGENGRYVVCGHLWKNQVNYQQSLRSNMKIYGYYVVGKCYWNSANTNIMNTAQELWPHTNFVQEREYLHSQVGMSIHMFSKEDRGVLIGAPGMLAQGSSQKGRGGVMDFRFADKPDLPSVRKRSTSSRSCRRKWTSNRAFLTAKCSAEFDIKDFDLWGYQVTSGNIFGGCQYVTSAPRGENLKGYVLIYEPGKEDENSRNDKKNPSRLKCDIRRREKGTNVGEYFGSSLAVADITGDGFDELIVGSPLSSTKELGDRGCINVFNYRHSESRSQTICGTKINQRFGTTLASLGDLDMDGFKDIAVGAPYEGHGVVYIYSGSPEGLILSQRIVASDLDSSLKGFGISFSRPQDIDNNSYHDIAIGSYLSEQVVLLRSYPVIDLFATIGSHTRITDANRDVDLLINANTKYEGTQVAGSLEMNYTLVIKSIPQTDNPKYKSYNITLSRGNEKHDSFKIPIQLREDVTAVEVELFVSPAVQVNPEIKNVIKVNNGDTKAVDNFCKSCHIERKLSRSTLSLPIHHSCKKDDCSPDLQLSCRILNDNTTTVDNFFIIGSSSVIEMAINISNFEDTAYLVITSIELPNEVKIAQIPSYCFANNLNITCKFDKIFENITKSISIRIEMSALDRLLELSEAHQPLTFRASSYSQTSEDQNKRNNYCSLTQYLIADMDAEIQSSGLFQTCDPVPLSKSTKDTEIMPAKFSHTYKVHKIGVTPTKEIQAKFFVPHKWKGSGASQEFTSVSIKVDDNQIICSREESSDEIFPKEVDKYATCNLPTSNRTLYINCTNKEVECELYICKLFNLKDNVYPRITIDVKMNTSILEPQLGQKDHILFSSHGSVEIEGIKNVITGRNIQNEVIEFTVFAPVTKEEELQTWIIVICVVAGILLLTLITFGLAKAGFFKRTLKDDMQKALNDTEIKSDGADGS